MSHYAPKSCCFVNTTCCNLALANICHSDLIMVACKNRVTEWHHKYYIIFIPLKYLCILDGACVWD